MDDLNEEQPLATTHDCDLPTPSITSGEDTFSCPVCGQFWRAYVLSSAPPEPPWDPETDFAWMRA